MSQTSTGARVVFRVNGTKVAFAQAMSYTVAHQHQPVDVLDQLDPVEYAETGYTVNFSVNQFRVANQSAMAIGLRPRFQDILTQPELTAELVDRITGATLALLQRVKCTEESLNIAARDIGQVTLNFVAIRMDDEGSL
jgi:hypothetical protein